MSALENRFVWLFGIPPEAPDWRALVARIVVMFLIIGAGVGFGDLVNDHALGGAMAGCAWGMCCGLAVGIQIGMSKRPAP